MKKIRLLYILLAAFCIALLLIFPSITSLLEEKGNGKPPDFAKHENSPPKPKHLIEDINSEELHLYEPDFHKKPSHENSKIIDIIFSFSFSFTLALTIILFISRHIAISPINSESATKKQEKPNRCKCISKPKIITFIGTLIIFVVFVSIYNVSYMLIPGYRDQPFGITLFKCLATTVVSILFAIILHMLNQHNIVSLEIEKLQTENIKNKYNALSSQINPHFFFNSLNALSYLIRSKNNDNALIYIDNLSDIFRYVLQKNNENLVTLKEELNFLDSYNYLLKIRFENKISININIPDDFFEKKLPAISLQPLIENIVKHNIINDENKMSIEIFINDNNNLEIKNQLNKKDQQEKNSKIGLENLNNRYKLLLNKEIKIIQTEDFFIVELQLL